MTIDTSPATSGGDDGLAAILGWHRAMLENWEQAQLNYFDLLAAWQKSVAAFNEDLFDQWVCRFGGGVPLDG